MKDIITGNSMTETRYTATEKWKEYSKASKAYKDPIYKDLQKVYNQVKNGQKVIDISKVIAKGGTLNGKPRLAISPIHAKKVFCRFWQNGDVTYQPDNKWGRRVNKFDVAIKECLPAWAGIDSWAQLNLEAPVPPVPPRFIPKIITDDYYILWEVDVWKMVPPTDPYLLRRITKTMFVVLAGWDLTDIEKSAMAGRMA
jgi:hypothetical protein